MAVIIDIQSLLPRITAVGSALDGWSSRLPSAPLKLRRCGLYSPMYRDA